MMARNPRDPRVPRAASDDDDGSLPRDPRARRVMTTTMMARCLRDQRLLIKMHSIEE